MNFSQKFQMQKYALSFSFYSLLSRRSRNVFTGSLARSVQELWPVSIREWKSRVPLRGQRKSWEANINVYRSWLFFIVFKIKLIWFNLSNPTYACEYR